MITVKVTYTVKPEFVKTNKNHIEAFLKDFQKMDRNGFRYHIYLSEDKKTFVHVSHFKDQDIQEHVLNIPSFKYFQRQRDESGLEMEPKIETMHFIGASYNIFQD